MRRLKLLSLLLFFVACHQTPTDTLGGDDESWQPTISADVEPCSNGDCPPPDDGCSNGDCPPPDDGCSNGDCPPPDDGCSNGDCPPPDDGCTNGDCPAAGGGQVKVEVCHRHKNGSFNLINIGEPALDAHLAHGDATPGEPVPGMAGYVFDEACEAVPACSCFDWADLDWAFWRDNGGSFVFITGEEASGPAAYLEVWDAGGDIVAWAYASYQSGLANCDFAPPPRFETDIGDAAAQACQTLIHDKAIELGCPAGGGTC